MFDRLKEALMPEPTRLPVPPQVLYAVRQTELRDQYEIVFVPDGTVIETFTYTYDPDDLSADANFIRTVGQVFAEIASTDG